jgi:hypothetical protein
VKQVLFIMTHLGSGWEALSDALASHPRIDCFHTGMAYDHYDRIEQLVSNSHKDSRSNSLWADIILHNHSFTCKPLINISKFVYLLREPRESLAEIIATGKYDMEMASRYYRYRLRGLCEYALRSAGYVLTYDRLTDLSGVMRHIGLKGVLNIGPKPSVPQVRISESILAECDLSYEKYLRHLKDSGLLPR